MREEEWNSLPRFTDSSTKGQQVLGTFGGGRSGLQWSVGSLLSALGASLAKGGLGLDSILGGWGGAGSETSRCKREVWGPFFEKDGEEEEKGSDRWDGARASDLSLNSKVLRKLTCQHCPRAFPFSETSGLW